MLVPRADMDATKRFFEAAFWLVFVDYGPDYAAFSGSGPRWRVLSIRACGANGRGQRADRVLSERLEETLAKVLAAGGKVVNRSSVFRRSAIPFLRTQRQ